MSDIKLTASGDLDLSGHRLNLATGEEAIEQQLKLRLRFFLGEHFLDRRLGIPYYRDILIKNPNLQLVRSLFKEAIETTPGIDSVDELQVSVNSRDRQLTVSFVATMDTGEELVFSPFIIEL